MKEKEILKEIQALKGVKPRIAKFAAFSIFGDDNVASIEIQIRVLDERMNEAEIDDACAEEDDDYLLSSAMAAFNWMEGNDAESPSEGWIKLADIREKKIKK